MRVPTGLAARLAALLVALGVLGVLPATAGAVLPGVNGEILFTSGRDDGAMAFSNNTSQIWVFEPPGGTPMRLTNNPVIQHRHPSWSPDYTKIAYAAGPVGAWDIWIQDLTKPVSATNPRDITNNPGNANDRPAWSPDDTRIAWEARVGGVLDVYVMNIATGTTTKLSAGATNQDAGGPAWSPDSKTIYYSFDVDSSAGGVDNDILKEPAGNTNGMGATPVVTGVTSDFQPAVSPDGKNLCFTRGPFTNMAQVWRSDTAGGNQMLIANSGQGDYNCVWSPDGTKIAYTQGAGATNGQLVMKNSDGTGPVTLLANHVSMRFDGNPDWARNGIPTCSNASVTVEKNVAKPVSLSCIDPPPENSSTTKSIVTKPTHGKLGSVQAGQPATVLYTPTTDFTGKDSFTFQGNDGTSNSPAATISIQVKDTIKPSISKVSVSPKRWRRGSLLAKLARLAPVGTTIKFTLSEASSVKLTFAKAKPGRKVNKKCVAPKRSNRNKPHCTRYSTAGSLTLNVRQGVNKVKFQGRLSRTRRLGLGSYRVTIDATDKSNNKASSRTAYFTIVAP